MQAIKDNTAYNLPTIEHFRELEKTKFSNSYSKSSIDFMYHFGSNTCFYFYEDNPNRYYLISRDAAKELGLIIKTYEKTTNR